MVVFFDFVKNYALDLFHQLTTVVSFQLGVHSEYVSELALQFDNVRVHRITFHLRLDLLNLVLSLFFYEFAMFNVADHDIGFRFDLTQFELDLRLHFGDVRIDIDLLL